MKHPSPALSPTLNIDMVDHLFIKHHSLHLDPLPSSSSNDHSNDQLTLKIETSWSPVLLPDYTPGAKDHDRPGSASTSPVDDPIYFFTPNHSHPKKHFGFSARQSIAASIFPWQKRKPVVCYPYSPFRTSGGEGRDVGRLNLKTLPVAKAAGVKHLEEEELDLLYLDPDTRAARTLQLLHLLHVQDWDQVTDPSCVHLHRISGALTNCVFLVTGPPSNLASPFAKSPPFPPLTNTSSSPPLPPPRKVLLRVYGIGLESLVSRTRELHWLQNLSTMDIGPSLLGIFKNGRFEEYVDSRTLTKEDLRDPGISRCIAYRMCELHNIVNVFPPSKGHGGGGGGGQTSENIATWIPLARQAIGVIGRKDEEKRRVMEAFGFERLVAEIDQVQREIAASVNSPIVFAHNDTQYGNILQTLDPSHELVVIDFEYAGYNTRGFDIANHFCEWMADYHSARPSIMHRDRYPTRQEQLNFLEAYIEAEIAITGYHLTAMHPHHPLTNHSGHSKGSKRRRLKDALASGLTRVASMGRRASTELASPSSESNNTTTIFVTATGEGVVPLTTTATTPSPPLPPPPPPLSTETKRGRGGVSKASILDSMYREVNKHALTSHVMWGLWGLIQASQSEIDFDYFEYALQRLALFREKRDEFMSL
ncbi:hypothetical protein MVEG_09504 [Podila verticillata NRRL 6337]|nr:hypothetical protein MVEG_09504 [Podila verticillata NRRL 6337]